MTDAIYKPGDWQFAMFWAIATPSVFILAATVAFVIGEFVGKLYP